MQLPEIDQEDQQWLSDNPNTSDIVEWIREYATKAVLAEREAVAKRLDERAATIVANNTYRGKVNHAAAFAAGLFEHHAECERKRSNAKVS